MARDEVAVPPDAEDASAYAVGLGDRLRRVRQQQGLSLHDVEERSGGALKASVVGAYERGERAVSITRLQRLASFYRVPVAELLPSAEGGVEPSFPRSEGAHVVLDLVELERHRDDEPELVRYAETIQARRGDRNGRVLTVRAADLQTLAAVLAASPEQLRERLVASGIVR
jgi:transcriptional regulator with XRE-family HTH domain